MSKSGASMIFVLGIMMFLMAIGVSTLAAAGANTVFVVRQNEFNRVRFLDESIHNSIRDSLQFAFDPADEDKIKESLRYQIAMAIYRANDPDYNGHGYSNINPGLDNSELEIFINDEEINTLSGALIQVDQITLKFQDAEKQQNGVRINNRITLESGDIIEPKSATLSALLKVEVELSVRDWGTGEIYPDGRKVTSVSIYSYSGGRLKEKDSPITFPGEMVFNTDEFGEAAYGIWELVSYGVINN